jgi:serine/threonine protein kinase
MARSGVKKDYSIDYDRGTVAEGIRIYSFHSLLIRTLCRFDTELGGGNFARVYHGHHRITNAEVAIKKTSKLNEVEVESSRWHNEVKVLRLISHPNCAEIYDSFESRRSLYIVMSFAAGGQVYFFHFEILSLSYPHDVVTKILRTRYLTYFCRPGISCWIAFLQMVVSLK